ncbi:MAG: extensin family protein [Polyangiaceae bacterium]
MRVLREVQVWALFGSLGLGFACAAPATHEPTREARPVALTPAAEKPSVDVSPPASATTASVDGALSQPSLPPPSPPHVPAPPIADADPGLANLDPSDDDVVGPPPALADCDERLRRAGVEFGPAELPLHDQRGNVCGAPQAVRYARGPGKIRFAPNAIVTCQLALGLAHFELVAQRLAEAHFGERIRSVKQGGTYNCRSMARFKLMSEHSYGNGIDLYEFTLQSGRKINVLSHFGAPSSEAKGAEGRFLRALGQTAFDENVFSVVVTRFFDELHRDHIHVDMAHYRTDGSR